MQITTLGPLAVDGRPVRGERLAAVIRALVDARGRAVVHRAARGGRLGRRAARRRDRCRPGAGVPGTPARAARGRGPGGYRVPAEEVTRRRGRGARARRPGRRRAARRRPGRRAALADEARALFPEVPELDDAEDARLFADVAALRAEAALAGAGPFDEADLRRLVARTPAGRAVGRPARAGARRAGPGRRGAGGGRATARRTGRPLRHRPVAGDHRGAPGAAARRAHRPGRARRGPGQHGADHAARRVAPAATAARRPGAGRRRPSATALAETRRW